MAKEKKSKKSKKEKSDKDETQTTKTKDSKKKKDKEKKSKDKEEVEAGAGANPEEEQPKDKKKKKESKKDVTEEVKQDPPKEDSSKDDKKKSSKEKSPEKDKKEASKPPEKESKSKKTNKSFIIVDPKDFTINKDDLTEVKEHQKLMGESPRKVQVHCNQGKKTCAQCYFNNHQDESIDPTVIESSKKIRDEIDSKIIDRLDHGEINMGYKGKDIDSVIERIKNKQIQALEKALENDPEYNQMKDFLEKNPELKMKYLSTLALNKSQINPIPMNNILDVQEHNSLTAKNNQAKGSRGWSEVKSNPTRGSDYSNSVRNSRYKAMGLDDKTKKEYFNNLKVIKKLQQDKKKRNKIIEYFDNQKVLKERELDLK